MPNASTEVAKKGYKLYRAVTPRPSLEEVNARLVANGHGVVSARMHEHYRKLDRHGLEDYLPINEVDVRFRRRP